LANSLKQYDNSTPEEADIIFADDHTYRNALKYGKPVAVVIDPWSDEIYAVSYTHLTLPTILRV